MKQAQKTLFVTLNSQAALVRLKQRLGLNWAADTNHYAAPAVVSAVKAFAKATLRSNVKHVRTWQGMQSNAALLKAARTGAFHHLPGGASSLVLSSRG